MNSIKFNTKKYFKSSKKDTIVCFDFFDTIISRKCSPEEVKQSWAKHCCERFAIAFSSDSLYKLRLNIENDLYNNKENNYEFDYLSLMKQVYETLLERDLIEYNKNGCKKFVEFSTRCEIYIEKKSQFINQDVFEVIRCFKSTSKKANDYLRFLFREKIYFGVS